MRDDQIHIRVHLCVLYYLARIDDMRGGNLVLEGSAELGRERVHRRQRAAHQDHRATQTRKVPEGNRRIHAPICFEQT